MADNLKFTVLIGPWYADGEGPFVDDVEVEKPSPALVRLASHAHAAGVLDVTEGLDLSDVQSQEDGEVEYAKAQEDGRWHEGNEAQHALQVVAADTLGAAEIAVDVEPAAAAPEEEEEVAKP